MKLIKVSPLLVLVLFVYDVSLLVSYVLEMIQQKGEWELFLVELDWLDLNSQIDGKFLALVNAVLVADAVKEDIALVADAVKGDIVVNGGDIVLVVNEVKGDIALLADAVKEDIALVADAVKGDIVVNAAKGDIALVVNAVRGDIALVSNAT